MSHITVTYQDVTGSGHVTMSHDKYRKIVRGDGDQREFDLETRVIINENIMISEMFHSCALNK